MTIVEAWVYLKITVLPLWMEMSLFLSGWHQIACIQYHSPPEVVIPLRVTGTSRGMVPQGWITYSLTIGGQRHIVHMKVKKLLVSRHLSVFTYTDQGALLEDQPFIQNDCYYRGYVEGDSESLVALSTCLGGLQGMLQINEVVYEIKPKRFSDTFEHLVYKMDSEETQSSPMRCGLTEEDIAWQLKFEEKDNSTLMQSGYEGWWLHQWFLELAIVVDHGRYLFRDSNISVVELDIVIGISLVNEIYKSIGLDVALIAIEIWNAGNPYTVSNTRHMMLQFCRWKKTSFNARVSHDAAHIVIKQDFCNTSMASTYYGTVCNINMNCGLECLMDDGLAWLRTSLTHELGHTLGMVNDDGKYCTCGRSTCIMNKKTEPSEAFSNCSYDTFLDAIAKKSCLHNSPNPESIITRKRCGNGVVEGEEECDCGSLKSCTNDPCCFVNCTLKFKATCASGLCCKDCQILPSGTLCREPENECDLPEWCNGTSRECPEDVYVEDGLPCLGKGFCFQKRCNHRDDQCRKIFGSGAKNGNLRCYTVLNIRGDRFGHCGMKDTKHVRCNRTDILCGRIQCENVTQIPLLSDHTTVLSTYVDGFNCWSTDYHLGMNIPDIGEVTDGTECGPGLMCLHQKCVPVPNWEESCLSDFCNKRGICNNKHHCHCNYEWAPPNCLKAGTGGSIDSGPAPKRNDSLLWLYRLLLIWIIALILCSSLLLWALNKHYKSLKAERKNIETSPKKEEQNIEPLPRKQQKDTERSRRKREQNVEPSPGKAEQNVEPSPGKGEQNVEPSPGKVEQNVETSPLKEQQISDTLPKTEKKNVEKSSKKEKQDAKTLSREKSKMASKRDLRKSQKSSKRKM